MTDSLRAFVDAVDAFLARLAAVHWTLLAGAVAFVVLNLALRARGWQGILRAALPGERIRLRTAFAAYSAGAGVNAVIPARAGDLVKMSLVRRSLPRATYPLLAGSLVCETLADLAISSCLLVWALQQGLLPGVGLPDVPAFDLSLAWAHPWWTLALVGVLIALGAVLAQRVVAFWRQFGQGLAVLRNPWRYLRSVAAYQALGWCCRVASSYFFLAAFGVPATLQNALTVQVATSLGGLFPATPGGLGPKQALLVVMLAGSAGRTQVLAFSAGMELTLVAVNVALGLLCVALTLRRVNVLRAISEARARGAQPEGESG